MEGSESAETREFTSIHMEPEATGPHDQTQSNHNSVEQSLPPCDRGIEAWRLLVSAFVFEALLWGMYRRLYDCWFTTSTWKSRS